MVFHGLDPVMSRLLWWALLLSVLWLIWWSYRKMTHLKPRLRRLLITLRSSALVILFLLLLNPWRESERVDITPPSVAVYLDDSRSLDITRGEFEGRQSYLETVREFQETWTAEVDLTFYRFSADVEPMDDPEDITLDGAATDLDRVLTHTRQLPPETVAAVLFSDGIATRGRDPRYQATGHPLPLFIAPAGDTSRVQDLAIEDVWFRDQVPVGTRQRVEVTLRHEGLQGETVRLMLQQNREEIDAAERILEENSGVIRHSFEVEFDEEGVHHLTAGVEEREEELTHENNRFPFAVEVRDETRTVVHLAYAVHPDVATVRYFLRRDPSNELAGFTRIGDNYSEGDPLDHLEEADLIILHGASELTSELEQTAGDLRIPVLRMVLPILNGSQIGDLSLIDLSRERSLSILQEESDRSHPILEGLPAVPSTLSLLRVSHVLSGDGTAGFETVLEGEIDQEQTVPLVLIRDGGVGREAAVTAYHWHQLRQSTDASVRLFAEELIRNLADWLSDSADRDPVALSTDRVSYYEDEEVRFRARIQEPETGEPVNDAETQVYLTNESGERQTTLTLGHRGEGNYEATAGPLAAGVYTYRGVMEREGELLGEPEGRFSVLVSPLELLDTRRDDETLEAMAEGSGGEVIQRFDEQYLRDVLDRRGLTDEQTSVYTTTLQWRQSPWWFLIVLALLSTEWVIRRRNGLA